MGNGSSDRKEAKSGSGRGGWEVCTSGANNDYKIDHKVTGTQSEQSFVVFAVVVVVVRLYACWRKKWVRFKRLNDWRSH